MKRIAVLRQSETPEFVQHLAYGGPDPTTIAGVRELIEQAGLNPYHYFTDEIAARVRDAIADGKASVDDGGDPSLISRMVRNDRRKHVLDGVEAT